MPSRIFISFASEDDDAREEIGRELARHGIDSYDYSKPHEGDQVGMRLEEQIAAEIERADLVIALISSQSTAPFKHVIQGEIHHVLNATDLMERGRLLPVVIFAEDSGETRPTADAREAQITSRAPVYHASIELARLRDQMRGVGGENWQIEFPKADAESPSVRAGTIKVAASSNRLEEKREFTVYRSFNDLFFPLDSWNEFLAALPKANADMLGAQAVRTWLGPFAKLQQRACTHVNHVGPGCFVALGELVCERLGLKFQPPPPEDSRLPFYDRLHGEIWKLPNHVRQSVLGQLDYFSARVPTGSWEAAATHIRALRSLLKQSHRDSYYARIIEGVCLLRMKRFDEALTLYSNLIDSKVSGLDENAWSGQAKALYHLGRHALALRSARQAVEFCDRKNDHGRLARLDWLRMAIDAHREACQQNKLTEGPDAELESELTRAFALERTLFTADLFENLGTDDRVKSQKLRAHCHAANGRLKQAIAAFDDVLSTDWTEIELPGTTLDGFPDELSQVFFSAMANAGCSVDDSRSAADGAIRVEGDLDDFHLIEQNETAWHFTRQQADCYRVGFLDLDAVISRHQLRWQISENSISALRNRHRHRWLEELEAQANLFHRIDLAHSLAWQWCELGEVERARSMVVQALDWFPQDPQLLQDAALLHDQLGDSSGALQYLEASARSARWLLLSGPEAEGPYDWTPAQLLEFWAAAQEERGHQDFANHVRRLAIPESPALFP